MAYETPITIYRAIKNIQNSKYVLPAIQREFVWDTDQIETLFDSLMRDYPIGTFLFWQVEKTEVNNFQFYSFLKNYNEKNNRHNKKIDLSGEEDVIALLDGQQRLTSLYIALTGSYAYKVPYKRKSSHDAYPIRHLYLNLLDSAEQEELEYEFIFLTESEKQEWEEEYNTHYFRCSEILDLSEAPKCVKYLAAKGLSDSSKHNETRRNFALDTLLKFSNIVHEKGTISSYLEHSKELDKVLQIFIRINSGGTKLSYSDLLLSIATAQWHEKDAREIIHDFVDELNNVGSGFALNKDIVLKTSLVLGDFKDVRFKVDNFNKSNMKKIEDDWDQTSKALKAALELVSSFGYSEKTLTAYNPLIPIAYFIYKEDCADHIVTASSKASDRKLIKEWLSRVLIKGTFGGQPDSIYPGMRDLINKYPGRFPLSEIIENYKSTRKSITFTEDDIGSLLELRYGQPKTYFVLNLIYPNLNPNFIYHQDHIHAQSKFSKTNLRKRGLSEGQIEKYIKDKDNIANLLLIDSSANEGKSDMMFDDWLLEKYKDKNERSLFLQQHFISIDANLALEDFQNFISNRQERIKQEILYNLNM